MRKHLIGLAFALLLALATPAGAQMKYPRGEFYFGASYLNVDTFDITNREHGYGWGASIAGNVHRNIGFVVDLGGHYGNFEAIPPGNSFSIHQGMAGPRFSARGEKATAFFHTLFGVVYYNSPRTTGLLGLPITKRSEIDFGMAIGGGVDYNINNGVAIRVFQLDWLPTRTSADFAHNFRAQTGVVFKFLH